jgi:hypothetical protein
MLSLFIRGGWPLPGSYRSESDTPGDVMMMDADFGTSRPGDVFLNYVGGREAVCLMMVDSLDLRFLSAPV